MPSYIYDLADTWNAAGTTFTAIKMNVTDTASAAGSLLMDLQVGGVSRFSVAKTGGSVVFGEASTSGRTKITLPDYSEISPGNGRLAISAGSNIRVYLEEGITVFGNGRIGFSSGLASTALSAAVDAGLFRDAAGVLAQRNSTNAQTLRWYRTFTDASNYERGALQTASGQVILAAETAGTGDDNLDVTLTPAGTGAVRFGTHAAVTTETVTGYIEIKDAGGTVRKIAVVS
jgi:hypothetical protein